MSRFLLLFVFLLWLAWEPKAAASPVALAGETSLFLGVYVAMVLGMAAWSRAIARNVASRNLFRSAGRVQNALLFLRLFALAWFGVGVYALGWGQVVRWMLGPVAHWPVELPGMVVATLPTLLTWVGLLWAEYPADVAVREQNMLHAIDAGMPVMPRMPLGRYLLARLRLQLLFSVVPILLIDVIHDAVALLLWKLNLITRLQDNQALELVVSLGGAALVLIFAPSVLKRVLATSVLPDSPLREKLERICQQSGLRYREILLWHTDNYMSNAAVMGIIPRLRYILLSDLLLETMTDEQIEAVFAHEVGHVVHAHLVWLIVFFVALLLALAEPGDYLAQYLATAAAWLPPNLVTTVLTALALVIGFGFISRRFERQADVFAARTVEMIRPAPEAVTGKPRDWPVGEYGAQVYASALRRVAVINNIPLYRVKPVGRGVRHRLRHGFDVSLDLIYNWTHGSIPSRMQYIESLGADPARTARFDRIMFRIYIAVIVLLIAGVASVTLL